MRKYIEVWETKNTGELLPFLVSFDNKNFEVDGVIKIGDLIKIEGVNAIPYTIDIKGKITTIYKESDKKWFAISGS